MKVERYGREAGWVTTNHLQLSLLGGRRAGWGTKCDLYIYSRTGKNLYPATVSQHWELAFLGCVEVIYPFVKSTGDEKNAPTGEKYF